MLLGYNFKPRLNSHAFGIVGSVVTMSLINEWMLAIEKPDWLACEQALRGALAVGREKEGEVATTSLEFEYLHQKSRCQMLIDGKDISNDVIILGTCFQCLFTFALVSASRWLAVIWQFSRWGATGELGGEFKFQGRGYKLSFLFPPRRQSAPESLLAG